MNLEPIWTDSHSEPALPALVKSWQGDRLFIITDENTHKHCLELFLKKASLSHDEIYEICIPAGEEKKSLASVEQIWQRLYELNASRNSIVLLLGGGVLLDMAGFAAATFKRGLRCINIPSTVLASVDAAMGGKRGFNYFGTKNAIGCFYRSESILFIPDFFKTLRKEDLLSGLAEMLKHALLEDEKALGQVMRLDLSLNDTGLWGERVRESMQTKQRIVKEDPYEHGVRQMLNLGHTFGHALEALHLRKGHALPHGYAVAAGLAMELFLSHQIYQYPLYLLSSVGAYIRETFPYVPFACREYEAIYQDMQKDKKNVGNEVKAALLKQVGIYAYGSSISESQCFMALDYYKDLYNA